MSVFTSNTASLPTHITMLTKQAYSTYNRTKRTTASCSFLFYSLRMLSRFLRIAFLLHSRVEKSIPMVQVSTALPQTCSSMRFFGKKGAL